MRRSRSPHGRTLLFVVNRLLDRPHDHSQNSRVAFKKTLASTVGAQSSVFLNDRTRKFERKKLAVQLRISATIRDEAVRGIVGRDAYGYMISQNHANMATTQFSGKLCR